MTNQRALDIFGMLDGPQTSLRIKEKEIDILLLLIGKLARLCFANSQSSQ